LGDALLLILIIPAQPCGYFLNIRQGATLSKDNVGQAGLRRNISEVHGFNSSQKLLAYCRARPASQLDVPRKPATQPCASRTIKKDTQMKEASQ
jgi:hypothetical protein